MERRAVKVLYPVKRLKYNLILEGSVAASVQERRECEMTGVSSDLQAGSQTRKQETAVVSVTQLCTFADNNDDYKPTYIFT